MISLLTKRPSMLTKQSFLRLLAQIEMDMEINDIKKRQQQQVLQKPNLSKSSSPSSKGPKSPIEGEHKAVSHKTNGSGAVAGGPKVQLGEDPDPEVRKKRDKVYSVCSAQFDSGANRLGRSNFYFRGCPKIFISFLW